MATNAVLSGTATENAALTYTLEPPTSNATSQAWESSTDGTTWTPIPGATNASFTPGDAEVGKSLRVVVQVNEDGTPTTATGTTAAVVAAVNDTPVSTLAIAGTAKVGEILALSGDITDADGYQSGDATYQWQVANGTGGYADIAGATAETFTLTQAQEGRAVRAVASYTDGQGFDETIELAPTAAVAAAGTGTGANGPPTGTLTITGTARQGETLTSEDLVSDPQGATGGRSYQWQTQAAANGPWTNIDGATGESLRLGQNVVGSSMRLVVSFTDDAGNPETFASAGTAVVENANLAPTGTLTVAGTVEAGQTLTLNDAVDDDDGIAAGARSYKWQIQGTDGTYTDIAGATQDTFTVTQAEAGRVLRGVLSYTDSEGKAETFLGAPTSGGTGGGGGNNPPAGLPVLDDGPGDAPVENTPVTVDVSKVTDADGLGTFAYAWSREDAQGAFTAIQGADKASYTPVDADVGGRLRVEASYTDGKGTKESFTLTTAGDVANVNDAPTGAVAFSGQAVRGQAITASTASLADADGIGPISLQWERADGAAWTPIAGATNPAYTPVEADVGRVLRAVATWTDKQGAEERVVGEAGKVASYVIKTPAPEAGETEENAAADELTSTDLARQIAEGGAFTPPAGVERYELADGVLSYGTGTAEAFAARLYLGLLGREGDVEGLAFLGEAARDGVSKAILAGVFLSSAEYKARAGEQTNAGFVEDLYTAFLGRPGGAEERKFWSDALDGGATREGVAANIAGSAESGTYLQASTTGVFVADAEGIQARSLYNCALGREADASGLLNWSSLIDRGFALRTLGDQFDDSAEFKARHDGKTDEAYVRSLYLEGAGRDADAAGLEYWTGFLESGQMARGELAMVFAMQQEARNDLDWAF
jgi:hypothetical protein